MQQQTFDTCTAFVIVPAFALPHYVYVRSPALHIAYCIALRLAIALLIIIIMQLLLCNVIVFRRIAFQPARCALQVGWVLRCAYYILHCYVYCTYYIVICGPITAYLLLHVMARLKRSNYYCIVRLCITQLRTVAAFAKRPAAMLLVVGFDERQRITVTNV